MAAMRIVSAMRPQPVQQAGTGIGQVTVPDLIGAFRQCQAHQFLASAGIENTEFDFLRVGRENREIHAQAVGCRTQRIRHARGQPVWK